MNDFGVPMGTPPILGNLRTVKFFLRSYSNGQVISQYLPVFSMRMRSEEVFWLD